MRNALAILIARIRLPAVAALIGLAFADRFVDATPGGVVWWGASGVVLLALIRFGTVRREPVVVRPPLAGRWLTYNSPASRVPSHGVQAYGQTYAIDFVQDPAGGGRPGFAWRPLSRRPEQFPGFGAPVLAPAAGVVVRAHGRERDHRSRTSPLGLLYLFTVELLRELFGPSRVVGNHVVIEIGDGVYAVLAHLRRGSISVRVGQRVAAGEQVGECGNSGNSTEPHLHFQLMDRPGVAFAAGIPFRFAGADGAPVAVPRSGEHLVAGGAGLAARGVAAGGVRATGPRRRALGEAADPGPAG